MQRCQWTGHSNGPKIAIVWVISWELKIFENPTFSETLPLPLGLVWVIIW